MVRLSVTFFTPSNANAHMRACASDFGSHGLSARRARWTKSRRPKGHKLEVGAWRAPKLLVYIYDQMKTTTTRTSGTWGHSVK